MWWPCKKPLDTNAHINAEDSEDQDTTFLLGLDNQLKEAMEFCFYIFSTTSGALWCHALCQGPAIWEGLVSPVNPHPQHPTAMLGSQGQEGAGHLGTNKTKVSLSGRHGPRCAKNL